MVAICTIRFIKFDASYLNLESVFKYDINLISAAAVYRRSLMSSARVCQGKLKDLKLIRVLYIYKNPKA